MAGAASPRIDGSCLLWEVVHGTNRATDLLITETPTVTRCTLFWLAYGYVYGCHGLVCLVRHGRELSRTGCVMQMSGYVSSSIWWHAL